MVDDDEALDRILEAVANPHRREILRVVGLQPCAISALARMRGLSLPAIYKHVKVLEEAALVSRRKQGRTTYLTLNRRPLVRLQEWVAQFHPYWGSDDATYENYLGRLDEEVPGSDVRLRDADRGGAESVG
jgi:DNA-binding transcriptional ArsR family regulator